MARTITDRPNVLLITVDQWRGDCLGIAGHPVVQTPTLDRLALQGVRFNRAYSSTPTCVPARPALLTGLAPEHHGRIGHQDGIPWTYPTTIATEFTRAGYQTEAIGKLHVYPERNRVGFQHVRLHDGYLHFARNHHRHPAEIDDYQPWLERELGHPADSFDHGLNCNSVVARPWDKPEYTHPTNWVTSEAIRFLDQRDPTAPFFLYLGYHRPHPPYDPPQWAFDMYTNADLPDAIEGDWDDILDPWRADHDTQAPVAVYASDIRRRALAGYLGHMSHIDHQLNRLLESMGDRNLLKNTWMLFVSDHGEMMGDHRLYRKSVPYEGSARVPLIVVPPPHHDGPRGLASDALTELRDIMPTLLDAVGLPIPDAIDGRSLLPLMEATGHRVLFGEHPALDQTLFWATDGNLKYIWWSRDDRDQLFDLIADPAESHDLALTNDHAEIIAEWRIRLAAHLVGREDGHADGDRLIPGRPSLSTLPSVIERWRRES